MPSRNIYSRSLQRLSGSPDSAEAYNLARLAQQKDQSDAQLEEMQQRDQMRKNHQAALEDLRQQQIDIANGRSELQNAKSQLDNQVEQQKLDVTKQQFAASAKAVSALSKLDPYDINAPAKVLAIQAQFPDAFYEAANGNHTMVQKAFDNFMSRHEKHVESIGSYAEKLGVDPLAINDDGTSTFIDADNGHFNIAAMKQASDARIAAQTLGQAKYSDAITKKLKDDYGITAPLATVFDASGNNPNIKAGTLDESGTFVNQTTPTAATTHYQINTGRNTPNGTPIYNVVPQTAFHEAVNTLAPMVPSLAKGVSTVQQPQQPSQIDQAKSWLSANPDHPMASKVQAKLSSMNVPITDDTPSEPEE